MLSNLTPRKLFLVDGTGALISAIMLGLVLTSLGALIGMPKPILWVLASFALVFSSYSFGCYFRFPKKWNGFLGAIALTNLIYCLITGILVFYFWKPLSLLGKFYFGAEIVLVVALSLLELKMAMKKQ